MSFVCSKWDDDLPSSPFDGEFKKLKKKRKRKKNTDGNIPTQPRGCGAFVKLPKSSVETVQNSCTNKLKRKNVVETDASEVPKKKKKGNLRTANSQLNTTAKSKNKVTNSDIKQNLIIGVENIISKKQHKLKRSNKTKEEYESKIPIANDQGATNNKISNVSSENQLFPSSLKQKTNQSFKSHIKSKLNVLKNGMGLVANNSKKRHKKNKCNKQALNHEMDTSAAISSQTMINAPQNQTLPCLEQETDNEIVSQHSQPKNDVNKNIPYNVSELKKYFDKSKSLVKTNKTPTNSLRYRMLKKLQSSHFRYINEQLYCSDSKKSLEYFNKNTSAFQEYHKGYQMQVQQWPLNPLDRIINTLKKKKTDIIIADFGCGEALLAKSLPDHKVHSFDFVATSDIVTPCDMANTPLLNESVDVVVFCLSLMGSNLNKFFKEANRVLRIGGTLMIAEVESRIENIDHFIQGIKNFGFVNNYKDLTQNVFYFLYFKKVKSVKDISKFPEITLKPCMYKKR